MNEIEIDNLIDNACQNGASSDQIIKIARNHKIGTLKLSNYTKSGNLTGLMILVLRTGKHKCLLLVIKEYLKKYPEEINMRCVRGRTALMMAAGNSNCYSSTETVKLLLDHGADVNILGDDWTPLMLSVMNSNQDSNTETVKLLLDYGANINAVDSDGWTALMMAALNSDEKSNVETVKLLLDHGADTNMADNEKWTALMMAAGYSGRKSDAETVKLLLDYGADINMTDSKGRTALSIAAKNIDKKSNMKIVKLLLEYNPDMNIIDDNGDSVFMGIIKMSGIDDYQIYSILQHKPNICLVNKQGKTIMGLVKRSRIRKILTEYSYDQYINEMREEIIELKQRIKFLEETIEWHPDNEEVKKLSESFYQKANLE